MVTLLLLSTLPAAGPPLPLCPMRALTGIPCASCGLTRGLIAAAGGQWTAALRLHPLAPVLVGALWAVAAASLLPDGPHARLAARFSRPAVRCFLLALGAAALAANGLFRILWNYWLTHPSLW
jgi:hypothetical protein